MNKKRGEAAELKFMAACADKGLRVAKPFGESDYYDVIVEAASGFLRVQVKSTNTMIPTQSGGRYRITAGHGKSSKQKYTISDIDVLACYVEPEDTWYLIPPAAMKSVTLQLYPHRLNEMGFYEKYKEAWEILNG